VRFALKEARWRGGGGGDDDGDEIKRRGGGVGGTDLWLVSGFVQRDICDAIVFAVDKIWNYTVSLTTQKTIS
jgi:hypothetical protein